MKRLGVLLTARDLVDAVVQAAPMVSLAPIVLKPDDVPSACDVLLTDSLSAAMTAGIPVWWLAATMPDVAGSKTPEVSEDFGSLALQVLGDNHVVGLVRVTHLAEDLAVAHDLFSNSQIVPSSSSQLLPVLQRIDFSYALANDRRQAVAVAQTIRSSLIEHAGFDAFTAARFGAAVFEAVDNAMCRGNLELSTGLRHTTGGDAYTDLREQRQRQPPYRDRRVWVTTRIVPYGVHSTVCDEGLGFDVAGLSAISANTGPPTRTGRGWLVLRYFCDEVRYNATGNEVTLSASMCDSSP